MPKVLSLDLWQRTLAAVLDEGLSHREVAGALQGDCRQRPSLTCPDVWWCGADARSSDIVAMDNPSSHTGPAVRVLIKAAGAELLYLPPYSPDFNPIENLFAKIKALLRKEAARTIDTLWAAIARIIDIVTPTECQNMFAAAGYDPDGRD
jgi:hypothetical protein